MQRADEAATLKVIERWLNTGTHILIQLRGSLDAQQLCDSPPYCYVFENIDYQTVLTLHNEFSRFDWYYGVVEIDDTSPVHYALYRLIPKYRIVGKRIFSFWDGISEDSKDHDDIELLSGIGFEAVEFESLNGRYTLFDKRHDFDSYRRTAELKQKAGASLAYLIDLVVTRLEDLIPDISERLWSAVKALEKAEVAEDHAHIAVSCRRILEFVIDSIEPPVPGDDIWGEGKFKLRIKKYADSKHTSDSTLDFVAKSGDEFKKQVDRLSSISSKGVHTDISYHEARRCFLRLIMLLDDILSLNQNQFPINIHYDLSWLPKDLRPE